MTNKYSSFSSSLSSKIKTFLDTDVSVNCIMAYTSCEAVRRPALFLLTGLGRPHAPQFMASVWRHRACADSDCTETASQNIYPSLAAAAVYSELSCLSLHGRGKKDRWLV